MSQLAAYVVRESDLVPHPTQAGRFLVNAGKLATPGKPWLTVNPDGSLTASDDANGEWQVAARIGAKIVWTSPSSYPTGAYALPLAEGL